MDIKWARFGTLPDRIPTGGVCLSSFVVLKRKNAILFSKVGDVKTWTDRFALPPKESLWRGKWLLPACHLKYGEHPDDAARRILREMIGIDRFSLSSAQMQSHLTLGEEVAGTNHWDVCFVYSASTREKVEKQPWFQELEFLVPSKVRPSQIGRSQADVLKEFGIKLGLDR